MISPSNPPFDSSAGALLDSWRPAASPLTPRASIGLVLIAVLLTADGCAVKRTTRVTPAPAPSAQQGSPASARELVERLRRQDSEIRTLNAQVDLAPTAGSVYSGVIKEYHDVRAYILLESPSTLRMIGLAPVVRTTIFDMVSEGGDGGEFRLYIPSKAKFIVGENNFERPTKNALESLRPQHILEALLIPPVDTAHEHYTMHEAASNGKPYHIIDVLVPVGADAPGELELKRQVWFDGATSEVSQLDLYGPTGREIENVKYSGYKDFGAVHYPSSLEIRRPVEDYSLAITVLKATFNQPLSADKFRLEKPSGAELVRLSEDKTTARPQGGDSGDQ